MKRLAVALQVTHQRKPGSIAPGLSEQLIVEFTGQQLRYHYDCIRVQTEVGPHSESQHVCSCACETG